jgi:arylsulfatase A-like enzyme
MIILSTLFLLIHCQKKIEIEKKQIILISIDTLRGDHLSSYGYVRDTSPHLSKLIKESVYYTNAYPNGCWTIPSHMSLLTGTLPSRHGINKDAKSFKSETYPRLSDSIKSIAEVLTSHHVNTIKFANLAGGIGFSKGFNKDNRTDPFNNNKNFDKLLKEVEKNKEEDFFIFIHTWKVHAPYTHSYFLEEGKVCKEKRDYINDFRKAAKKVKDPFEDFKDFLKENNLFNPSDCVALYDSGIRYVDQYIGKLIDKTKQLRIYDNLLFIIVSDHGEHFNEHYAGRFYGNHGSDFYEEFVKVPLIIKYPYSTESKIINHPVSLIDVFPTILDFYRIEIPAFVQGDSLLKPASKRNRKYLISEAVSIEKIERKMIMLGDLKYIITMGNPSKVERVNWNSISQRRLFDLKNDPLEQINLCKDLKFRGISTKLEKRLKKAIENSSKSHFKRKETTIDEKTLEQLEALGYLK